MAFLVQYARMAAVLAFFLGVLALRPAHAGNADEARWQAMEQRIAELEARLERTERENARLRAQSATSDKDAAASESASRSSSAAALRNRVVALETKLEQSQKAAAEQAKSAPKVDLGANGLSIQSPDGNQRWSLRSYLQADSNFFLEDASGDATTDRFQIRRARLTLDGTLFKWIDVRLAPDFGAGNVRLFDGFVDLHYVPWAALTVGKFRPPINGLERQQAAPNLMFVERALTQDLTPTRDVGVMLHGQIGYPGYTTQYTPPPIEREFLSYQVGVFNGARDSENLDTERDDNKEVAARLFAHPFMHSGISALQGLGIGIAGSVGQPNENPLRNLATDSQQNFLTYKSGVTATGDAYRLTPQAYWYWGPFALLTEYVMSAQTLKGARSGQVFTTRQDNQAWQVAVSYVLTGENNSFFGIKPAQPFDPAAGTWGAWQLSARWSELNVDSDTFKYSGVFADPGASASAARAWAVGLNWWLNNHAKIMADYEETRFQGGATATPNRPTERAVRTRVQYQF